MEMYLVGGAVRDEMLGLAVTERDWVVVGATPEQMLELGYRQVGRDFPVFLHPDSGEEYALARTERKCGHGYHGFEIHAAPEVTLEQDLQRRDLTVNAMARDTGGHLLDPHGGRDDLERRILRHVSPAFTEDPLRVLRVARFLARFADMGFVIAPETLALMGELSASGELQALAAERVWQETERALGERRPDLYFQTLRDCGALAALFPELDALFGVPQPRRWHPEVDTGVHTLMVLARAAELSDSRTVRFAALVHDLGKGSTPRELWPSHPGHEARSVEAIMVMCRRLRVPNTYRELATKVAQLHGMCHRMEELKASTRVKLLEQLDAFRRPDLLEDFLLACEADARGRSGLEHQPYPQADLLRRAYRAAAAVRAEGLDLQGLEGRQIGQRVHEARVHAVRADLGGG